MNEEKCNGCQYWERVDGEFVCSCDFDVWESDDSMPCKQEQTTVTVGEAAAAAITLFANDCKQIAEKNWTPSQVDMLEMLFESAAHGCEYKCVRCKYFGRLADAPETVEKDCMWEMLREEGEGPTPPCEEE